MKQNIRINWLFNYLKNVNFQLNKISLFKVLTIVSLQSEGSGNREAGPWKQRQNPQVSFYQATSKHHLLYILHFLYNYLIILFDL